MAAYTEARVLIRTSSTSTILPICSKEDSKTFLEKHARGAYTTARTVRGSKIFELDTHVKRLSETAMLMWPDQALLANIVEPSRLRAVVMKALRVVIEHHRSRHKPLGGQAFISQEELKLTILFVWHTEDSMLECLYHVSQLPLRPSPPIKVEVRGAPRSNAKAKDSGWVRDRKRLEFLKPVDTNEILLRDLDGALLEGTQTNFYVVMEGKLWTAGEGVLEGTVRKLVLEACAAHHVPVILHPPPNLKDLQRWEGALLSSTSRLLLPIDWIGIPQETMSFQEGDVCRAFKYENDCLTSRLVEWVDDNILQSSVDV
ncbi:hypothetical protein NSK_004878 [Nannochloropsis salina CCMP1776]|uniref:Uncharacterized protein n=1 Tax=Nannochloropsis salina CCMP1776 TaxID=1027361 RepID=A0A4D9CXN7_9STRA|nr:hypothetical protein NSK_004878 [Nannochloropsis salina CCMP1776]|eukprot:TFJ83776.1 hypothetical protein NSK_004878 [Nannochloropsis salina CCMP1776]